MSGFGKISSPQFKAPCVALNHDRLRAVIAAGTSAWLCGQAGSGKTTAVATHLKTSDIPHVWYRADATDHEPASFFHYFALALAESGVLAADSLPAWTSDDPDDLSAFAQRYFRQAFSGLASAFAIVVDDCNMVRPDASFWQILGAAVQECPSSCQLWLISRDNPPPALAHAVAHGDITLLDQSAFRLSASQSTAVLDVLFPGMSPECREAAIEKAGGWITGLTQYAKLLCSGQLDGQHLLQDYLQTEIFGPMPDEDRALLLETVMLPALGSDEAIKLTGNPQAGRQLSLLAQRTLIVEQVSGNDGRYRLLPLFRDFLVSRAASLLSPERIARLCQQAQPLLSTLEDETIMVTLLAESHNWDRLSAHVAGRLTRFSAENNMVLLADWLKRVPASVILVSPWLNFAQGCCLNAAATPAQGYEYFCRAWEQFSQARDVEGLALAWAGAVDAFSQHARDYTTMDVWIERLEMLFSFEMALSGSARQHVAQYGLVPVFLRQPDHPLVPLCAGLLEAVIHHQTDPGRKIAAALPLVRYYSWSGSTPEARMLIKGILSPAANAPLRDRVIWHNLQAMCGLHGGEYSRALNHVEMALALLPPQATVVLRSRILICGGYAATENSDFIRTQQILDEVEKNLDQITPFEVVQYHFIAGWNNLTQNRFGEARSHFEESLKITRDSHINWGSAFLHASLVYPMLTLGYPREAHKHLKQAQQQLGHSGSRLLDHFITITQAWYEIENGSRETGLVHLERAFAMARKENYLSSPWLARDFLGKLCMLALRHKIEVDFVRRIIRQAGVMPESPPIDIPDWPWPVRILTLGRFAVLQEDVPVPTSAKGQGKPLELLKLMIALGGRDIPKQRLIATLWPELDADYGDKAFDTTLYRLRKMLGMDRAVYVQAGLASINHHIVWIDVWALNRLVSLHRHQSGATSEPEQLIRVANEALEMYHGDFLGHDNSLNQYGRKREQLRKVFSEIMIEIASVLVANGRSKDAESLYNRALERIPDTPEILTRYTVLTGKALK